ncbi:Maintenance of telomere capping protein 1 [Hypsizygus marmoreus]|uniref:Maintenance of telomere capping protein 1 n=1 Tax=Hypsizygus marmoreus TaxID=39966 RepID=A0A369K7S0_HYPMA|nr:Maintenance of telomere capping protein 1 [Hypsizygus marmoreus]
MSKAKSKQEEALQFLDDLDSFTPPPEVSPSNSSANPPTAPAASNEGEAEVLAFIDEITQKSAEPTRPTTTHLDRPASRSGTPTLRKSTERVRLGGGSTTPSPSSSSLSRATSGHEKPKSDPAPASGGGAWGWGSVWSTASTVIQQAKTVVDEQVKALPKNEQARKWGEGVIEYAKAAQLDKIGQDFKRVGLSTLTDILNVVAPPISEHEVIQVWLSHDMQGYDGVESLVYRALSRIMEQVEGGDLVVNRGDESRPKEAGSERNFNTVEGYDAAFKLAQADIDEVIKNNTKATAPNPSSQSPTTYSHVYLRVQPYYITYEHPASALSQSQSESATTTQRHLHFLLYFSDPAHQLTHTTITQAVPANWLSIWDDYEWVEDLVAEALRVGVEVVGQEYLVARMGWGGQGKPGKEEVPAFGETTSDVADDGKAEES